MGHDKMKYFLRWVLICAGITVGIFFLGLYEMFSEINQADFTKLSFVIFALFLYFTAIIGLKTYQSSVLNPKNTKRDSMSAESFFANQLVTLGMIGTVSGFIYMLSTAFQNVNTDNIESMQALLSTMAAGMSTALYTTAAGLICSLILKLQIFNYEQLIDDTMD